MQNLPIKRYIPCGEFAVEVPASKSILNRALLLAALAHKPVALKCGSLCDDTRALLSCLEALGVKLKRTLDGFTIFGYGEFPKKTAELNVQSAGTAARFLPAVLAFCGGEYLFTSSEQMQKRPMDVLNTLSALGVEITYLKDEGHFPFRLLSHGITASKIEVQTDVSTQFASGLLLAASAAKKPVTIVLRGKRTAGSYVDMTLSVLRAFGVGVERTGDEISITPARNSPDFYRVEGDLSGACYFCALALLLHTKVFIRAVSRNGLQGDAQFLKLLEEKGVRFTQTPDGLLANGEGVVSFTGFKADFHDFSDQTLTAAALAPFASTLSVLKNVAHIRLQECDRIAAIVENINSLGGSAKTDGTNVFIEPRPLTGGTVKTFGDHRVAMAFALAGLKTGTLTIDNPDCANKTFGNYFDILSNL